MQTQWRRILFCLSDPQCAQPADEVLEAGDIEVLAEETGERFSARVRVAPFVTGAFGEGFLAFSDSAAEIRIPAGARLEIWREGVLLARCTVADAETE